MQLCGWVLVPKYQGTVNVSMVELVPSKIPDKQEIKLVVLFQSLQSYANSLCLSHCSETKGKLRLAAGSTWNSEVHMDTTPSSLLGLLQ